MLKACLNYNMKISCFIFFKISEHMLSKVLSKHKIPQTFKGVGFVMQNLNV